MRVTLQHHALEIARLDKHVSVMETELKGVHNEIRDQKVTLERMEEGLKSDIADVRTMVAAAGGHSQAALTSVTELRGQLRGAGVAMALINGVIVFLATVVGMGLAFWRLGAAL
jgi:t-SNARE complex subunit (syntaxin)